MECLSKSWFWFQEVLPTRPMQLRLVSRPIDRQVYAPMRIPDITEWDTLSLDQQLDIARALQSRLPASLRFTGVRRFSMKTRSHAVALFSADNESVFALIPGGEVELGFDASGWEPSPDEAESWADTAEEYGIEKTLTEHIDSATTPRRRVAMDPFLIETRATEVGWERIGLDDPDAKELVDHFPSGNRPHTSSMSRGGREIRVARDPSGRITAEIANHPTHETLCAALRDRGFRFPTSDEWEFVCGAGATTLFRWGDHVPCDRYPTDISPAEAAWRSEWVLSAGKLDYPAEGFEPDWDFHRRPNAFGLIIAENPYKYELVAEADTTRGGDGGCTICGGTGFFVGWLTLATAYFEPHACKIDPEHGISAGYTIGRRVLPLA